MRDAMNDFLATRPMHDEDRQPEDHVDETRDVLPPDSERRGQLREALTPGVLPAGTRLGDYVLAEVLGRGGCATVYRAVQRRLGRAAVVKVAVDESHDPTVRREADMARQLQHPGLIHFYDAGHTDDGRCWLAMELVSGQSLGDTLADRQPMPYDAAMSVLLQLLDALAVAHDQRIVHRDIKPGNVMLTRVGVRDDIVKLLDFGAAIRVNKLGQPLDPRVQGSAMGTPRYMAPELLNGTSLPASDVYAVALVAVEMLTGLPYIGGNDISLVLAHHLRGLRPLPPEVATLPIGPVLNKALAREPDERYPHARAFYDALVAANDRAALRRTSPALMTAFTDFVDVVSELDVVDTDDIDPDEIALVDTGFFVGMTARELRSRERRLSLRRIAALCLVLAIPMAAAVGFGFWTAAGLDAHEAASHHSPAPHTDDDAPRARALAMGLGSAATQGALSAWRPASTITTLRLESSPGGARVTQGDRVLCELTPCEIGLTFGPDRQPLEIQFELAGYASHKTTLTPDADTEVRVALARLRRHRRSNPDDPRDAPSTAPRDDDAWAVLP